MAATRILSIIGRKNAGKTTLTVALARELARRGERVMTIKHGHHPADVDREGSDSWRHFREGPAERVLLATPDLRVLFEWVERDEQEGVAEAPYPPNFPKMPGEPKRVQPSRAKKPAK